MAIVIYIDFFDRIFVFIVGNTLTDNTQLKILIIKYSSFSNSSLLAKKSLYFLHYGFGVGVVLGCGTVF